MRVWIAFIDRSYEGKEVIGVGLDVTDAKIIVQEYDDQKREEDKAKGRTYPDNFIKEWKPWPAKGEPQQYETWGYMGNNYVVEVHDVRSDSHR